jgi:hypothetical protein
MTKTKAPQPPKIISESKVPSKKSICPGKSHIWNCTKLEFEMSSLMILLVLSKNSVSFGDILWNTTFWIEDLPLLNKSHTKTNIITGKHTSEVQWNPYAVYLTAALPSLLVNIHSYTTIMRLAQQSLLKLRSSGL